MFLYIIIPLYQIIYNENLCSHGNTIVAMEALLLMLLLPWKRYCYHGNAIVAMETLLLPWKRYCWHGNAIVAMETLLLPWERYCCHGNAIVTMETLLLLWKHYCCHGNAIVTIEILLLLWKHYCCYGNTIVTMETLLLLWKRYCFCFFFFEIANFPSFNMTIKFPYFHIRNNILLCAVVISSSQFHDVYMQEVSKMKCLPYCYSCLDSHCRLKLRCCKISWLKPTCFVIG